MVEPQLPVNTAKIAYKGKAINLNELEEKKSLPAAKDFTVISEFKDYEPSTNIDMNDLREVNKEILNLRMRLHRIRKEFDKANRIALQAKFQYEQDKKRILIGLSGGSDKQREAIAEIMCEELLAKSIVAQAVSQELANHSRDTRIELDALKEISNNLRKQIDI
jgi:hypothetical protein